MKAGTCAVIKRNTVENIILVDMDNIPVIEECLVVPIGAGAEVGGGYADGKFTARVRTGQQNTSSI